ncbi:hypothetical protein B0T21DRAFT_372417, partial [Apiosordaria backusii]
MILVFFSFMILVFFFSYGVLLRIISLGSFCLQKGLPLFGWMDGFSFRGCSASNSCFATPVSCSSFASTRTHRASHCLLSLFFVWVAATGRPTATTTYTQKKKKTGGKV